MSGHYEQLLKQSQSWAAEAEREHWLSPTALKPLAELDQRSPAALFSGHLERPLVAAFFGGTGVGKSTLLNRLAGQPIARTGVERPTSREVSLYLHDSIPTLNLPAGCPLEQVRKATHQNDDRRHVLWVDMPDIDSVEEHNRDLVLAWLPYVDVVIYVVSPERYRDDRGWRLLRDHGSRHAWLFVINQWDKGHEVQYHDFQQVLAKTGFTDPIILRTDSREQDEQGKTDDFERLQNLLDHLTDRHILGQIENRADGIRMEALSLCLRNLLEQLGDRDGYRNLEPFFTRQWANTRNGILQGLEWPMRRVAREFVGREASPLARRLTLLPRETAPVEATQPPSVGMLWDDWADSQFRNVLDQLVVEAGRQGLALTPLRAGLAAVLTDVEREVLAEAETGLRNALIRPGHAVQRFLLGVAGLLKVILPLSALGWASFQVVQGYYESTQHHTAYLGTDFAVHSSALIALAWLLPFFLYRLLTPSAERSAIRGLGTGLATALAKLELKIVDLLHQLEENRSRLIRSGTEILKETATGLDNPKGPEHPLLGQVFVAPSRANPARTGKKPS